MFRKPRASPQIGKTSKAMNIESFFPGRLRVNSKLFTKQENVDRIKEMVGAIEGIRTVVENLRTGSVTVTYDSGRISMQMLMDAKEELEKLERDLA